MKKMIILATALIAAQVVATWLLLRGNDRKMVYADTIRLVDNFKLKAELETAGRNGLSKIKNELDSASTMLGLHPDDELLQQTVAIRQRQLEERYGAIASEINRKVWERLNPLIQEFGKEQQLDIVIGANGMGTVLYASDKRDITEQLIRYINERYEKGR